MLKLVPFNNAWITHEKIDIKGIYRRPRWKKDEFDQDVQETSPDGQPLWDLTGPLPIKQHNKWMAKGFEFVTLADRESLFAAAATSTLIGGSARDYDQHQTGGPWNAKMYAAGQADRDSAASVLLRENVQRFGSEAYEAIRRETDPNFRLPASLRGIAPGGELPALETSKATAKSAAAKAPAAPKSDAPAPPRRRRRLATPAKNDGAAE